MNRNYGENDDRNKQSGGLRTMKIDDVGLRRYRNTGDDESVDSDALDWRRVGKFERQKGVPRYHMGERR